MNNNLEQLNKQITDNPHGNVALYTAFWILKHEYSSINPVLIGGLFFAGEGATIAFNPFTDMWTAHDLLCKVLDNLGFSDSGYLNIGCFRKGTVHWTLTYLKHKHATNHLTEQEIEEILKDG